MTTHVHPDLLPPARPAAQRGFADGRGSVGLDPAPLPVTIRLLGVPGWTAGGRQGPLQDARAAVLLAMVALDGPVQRPQAAEMFWPQSFSTARTNLRVMLHRLQQAIGSRIFDSGDRLTLGAHVRVDLNDEGNEIVDRCLALGAANARLLHGVELGDLGEASQWLVGARSQVEQRLVRTHTAWLTQRAEGEQLERAMAVAESLIAISPLGEIGYRELMKASVERGDRAGALAAYERCKDELSTQLGTSPDPQTTALHRDILRLRDEPAAPATPVADATPLRRPLLQREHEMEQMERALASRRVVIVEGASGSGKTALLGEFARRRSDFYWTAEESDGLSPLAGLQRLTFCIGDVLSPDAVPPHIEAARSLLARVQRLEPALITAQQLPKLAEAAAGVAATLHHAGYRTVVLDDIHLLDDSSLDVVAQVVQRSRELMPWCDFVLAYRPIRARRKVRALCEKLAMDGRLRLVHPSPLRRDAVMALSERPDPAFADRLIARSGGVPGVVVELVEMGAASTTGPDLAEAPLPPQIASILLERLRSCSSTANGLAQLASVAGPDFNVALAASVAGLSSWKVAEKWNELLLAGVFDARGFAFPLMQAAVAASVPDAVRQFMHGEVAKELERQGAPSASLVFHWLSSGDRQRAFRHARSAAAERLQAGDIAAAIRILESAASTADSAYGDTDALTLLQLAALYLQTSELEKITEVLDAAVRATTSAAERGAMTALGGRALLAMKEHNAARAAFLGALPLLEDDPVLHRAVACWAAMAISLVGDDAALAALDDSLGPFDDVLQELVWGADAMQVHTPADGRRCIEELRSRRPALFHHHGQPAAADGAAPSA